MTEYEKRVTKAGEVQKDHYNRECIFSATYQELLVDAHIFKRSTYPELAALRFNRFPLAVDNDKNLERVVNPWKRIAVIITYVHEEHRQRVMDDIRELISYVIEHEIKQKGGLS